MSGLVRLGDVCHTTSGGTPSRSRQEFFGGSIPWVKSGNLNDGIVCEVDEHLTEAGLASSSAKIFPSGTLLIAMYGATVGKLGVLGMDAATNQAVCGIQPDGVLDRNFLFYFLLHKREALVAKSIGGAQPNISQAIIRDTPLPLPPLDEQRRIVSMLDQAAEIRRRADAARAKAKAIIPALFLDMFGAPATNSKQWPVQVLAELADIGSGLTKGRKLNGTPTVSTPYLRVANVQADRLDLSEIKLIDATREDRQRCRLEPGDLLMTEGGDMDKLGRCAMWRGEIGLCLHQNHVFRVRMGKTVIPDYGRAFMQSEAARGYFLRVAKRTTGIASINKTQLGQLPVWVPPLPLQMAFAEQAQRIEASAHALDIAAAKAEAMTAALSARVFDAPPKKGETHAGAQAGK